MSQNRKKFTLACAVGILAALSVACGTRGNNVDNNNPGQLILTGTGTGTTTGTTTGTATSNAASRLTGGTTGSPTVNPSASPTPLTGLVTTNLITQQFTGSGNPLTRLTAASINGFQVALAAQSNGLTTTNPIGEVIPRTLGDVNVPLAVPIAATTGTAVQNSGTIVSPFDLLVAGGAVFLTDGMLIPNNGRVLRVNGVDPATGNAQVDIVATGLSSPIDMIFDPDANSGSGLIYVANYQPPGSQGTGSISFVDPAGTGAAASALVTGLNSVSSMALDRSNNRRFLWVCENQASGLGDNGRVIRINLADPNFTAGAAINTLTGNGAAAIVSVPQGQAFLNPWEVEVDAFGNVVISEGMTYQISPPSFSATQGVGRIRVIPTTGAETTPPAATTVLTGLTGPRGLSVVEEGPAGGALTGTDDTVFFVNGALGQQSEARQVTFRNDGGIFSYLSLATVGQNALDTLFDPGDADTPSNLKVTVGFIQAPNGQVVDIR